MFSIAYNNAHISPVLLFVILLGAVLLVLVKTQSTIVKTVFILCTDIFLFCFAVNLVENVKITNDAAYFGRYLKKDSTATLLAEINQLPVEKDNYVKCEMAVLAAREGNDFRKVQGNLIAYFKKSKATQEINFGKVILLSSRISEIEEPKNPAEFDYKSYMANRQVYHTAFIDSNDFSITGIAPVSPALWIAGLRVKQYVLNTLSGAGLSPEARAISEALLTGYSQDIDRSVMDAFAHSGTLHVLSVSGLHTGLIYLLLAFIFDCFDRRKKYKVFKFIFISTCLWFFALVTGFSAPVLRAVIMFNLIGFGKIFFRNDYRNQVNILLVSAFILLCYDPFLVMDIGFQLSYSAMLGIFIFLPFLVNFCSPRNKFQDYLWKSVCASFAATITTLPFTLFYFKQFPLWFFVCNIIVVPATFIVLVLAFLLVLNAPVATIINFIIKWLITFINLFDNPGAGYIKNIHFEWVDAILLSVLIVLISLAINQRSYRLSVFSFLIIIAWQLNGIFVSYYAKQTSLFTVYHMYKEPGYSLKNKNCVSVNCVAPVKQNFHINPHCVSFNYPLINNTSFNFIKSGSEEILALNKSDLWPSCNPENITTLVVSNNFRVGEKELLQFKNVKIVIADGSNSKSSLAKLVGLCNKNGISFYSTKDNGAYSVEL